MSDQNQTEPVVEVNTDVAKSKLARHKKKIQAAALAALAGTAFFLGRKSKDVDVDVSYDPDSSNQD